MYCTSSNPFRKLQVINRYSFLCALFLCVQTSSAQNQKGFSTTKQEEKKAEGKTYALICGISNYKNPAIPSLQFADKDAIAFRNYLVATGVDSNNVTLLINEKATNIEFWASINFLTDIAKPGDKVFIYFSGHGDVENKTVVKDAYLLPYDSPKCVYPSGAIGIYYLKNWIATLSANGIQAVFIADACRSGNLAGGREGMAAAEEVLKDKWVDEIKILSCQPGELSIEGKQWGNGRGLFSFELINGISGLADKNKDGKVSLRELNLYLMEKVPEEATPLPQNPMLSGNMEASVATINPKLLAEISSQQNTSAFASIDTRGFDETLLKNLHDSIKINYHLFKSYLDRGILIRRYPSPSAYTYFKAIPDNDSTKLLLALMKRNYSAALLESLSQVKDEMMGSKNKEYNLYEISEAGQLLRSILGTEKLKEIGFLPGILAAEASMAVKSHQPEIYRQGLAKLDSSILLAPNSAMLYFIRGWAKLNRKDLTAISDLNKAIEISPKFLYAYQMLGGVYQALGQNDSVITIYKKLLAVDSVNTFDTYKAIVSSFLKSNKKDSAQFYFQKFLNQKYITAHDSIWDPDELNDLGDAYYNFEKYDKAIEFYFKAIAAGIADSKGTYYNISCCYSLARDKQNALKYLEVSFKKGWDDYKHIGEDTDLDNIRNEAEFTALMKKYFQEQYKER